MHQQYLQLATVTCIYESCHFTSFTRRSPLCQHGCHWWIRHCL